MNISTLNIFNPINPTQNILKQGFRENLYSQKPDTFTRTTPLNFTGNKTKNYNNVIKSLSLTNENALFSLNGQIAADGWSGKTADWISGAWRSKNRAHLVKADIDTQKTQIEELKQSIKENNFEGKFKEIFGIDYNQVAIDKYNKKAEEFKLAVTTKCIADITKEKLSKPLKEFRENNGELKDKTETRIMPMASAGMYPLYTVTTEKEKFLNNIKNSLIEVVGSEERLNKLIKKNGVNLKKATDEEKYKAYGSICDLLIETSKSTAEKCSGGKTLEELDTEYEETYQNAYGNKNNIQIRVDDYNRSQEIGAAAVRGVVRSGIVAATVATAGVGSFVGGLAVGASATFGAKMIAEISDKMTNDIDNNKDLSRENIHKMLRSAAISSADYIASRGIRHIVPDFETSSEVLNSVLNIGKDAVINTATGMVSEYYKQGQWNTNQIIPRLLISSTFDLVGKNNEHLMDELMDLSKGGLSQAMKKKYRDYDAVKEFVQGTKIVLDENYVKNPAKYGDLKVLSAKNPEKYEEYICELLEAHLKEKANSKQ